MSEKSMSFVISIVISFLTKLHSASRYRLPVLWIEYVLKNILNSQVGGWRWFIWDNYRTKIIQNSKLMPQYIKFTEKPNDFFEAMAIVLRSHTVPQKGILLLKYSYSFPLFFAMYDVDLVAERYHIVLEPSWTGYCDGSILCYAGLKNPVFVQSLESKDSALLLNISENLIPVEIGANWWVDHRIFRPRASIKKDSDICVIASWSRFKNHEEIFDAVRLLKKMGNILKLILIGYSVDMTKEDILHLAMHKGIAEQVEIYEGITSDQVAIHLCRCKVNLVWSKREGVNRAIIEGFLCNVPGILREGFNYGTKYKYINDSTGTFSSKDMLVQNLQQLCENYKRYNPRKWVMDNQTCQHAIENLVATIGSRCGEEKNKCSKILSKVNFLDGMRYFDEKHGSMFDKDYDYLKKCMYRRIVKDETNS
jgi:glycosyltransferase involved in cell wall biosynthesis